MWKHVYQFLINNSNRGATLCSRTGRKMITARSKFLSIEDFLGGNFGGFIRGVDYDLAFIAHADAFGADAGDVLEGEMDDAAFARGHGIEAKGLARSFYTFCGDFGGHAQLFKA